MLERPLAVGIVKRGLLDTPVMEEESHVQLALEANRRGYALIYVYEVLGESYDYNVYSRLHALLKCYEHVQLIIATAETDTGRLMEIASEERLQFALFHGTGTRAQ